MVCHIYLPLPLEKCQDLPFYSILIVKLVGCLEIQVYSFARTLGDARSPDKQS